ncbi:hypothetical protein [Paraliomyxa miuraensis]|uniref:hypothetical protein n=1 Tax=Paraliomyxa miuraensis TaxID=376150 RepID=UPI00224E7CA9|nr:hypothetical protein [Paraliomyxa miuraensis]MCX4245550.1 hypothetical protein [Paraliomyxa miuraensis]
MNDDDAPYTPADPSRTVRIERLRLRVTTSSRVAGRHLAQAVAAQLTERADGLEGRPNEVVRVRMPIGPTVGRAVAPTIAERIMATSREGEGRKGR